jgi:NTE family protein
LRILSLARPMSFEGKRVGVVLSSSFFGFYAHAGFLAGLDDLGIRPAAYGGASAGALISAFAAAGLSTTELRGRLMSLKRSDFWDPDYKSLLLGIVTGFHSWKGLLKGEALRNLVTSALPNSSFEACPTPCCIIATDLTSRTEAVFSSGSLIDAVCASIAVPGLFKPCEIDRHLYVDGGIVDKVPLLAVHDLFQPDILIVHYLASSSLETTGTLPTLYLPFKFNRIAHDISRELRYRSQLRTLEGTSCQVIEISSSPPRVSPLSLANGTEAYDYCREHTHRVLSEIRSH